MTEQLTTFQIHGNVFGIEVMKVQEVTGRPAIVDVPLAPAFVRGLINLRGQIATALGLRELFGLRPQSAGQPEAFDVAAQMSVVCRIDGNLVSLLVDSIGDVIEVKRSNFEPTPETIPLGVRKYVKGIYKTEDKLLSVLDLDRIARDLANIKE